VTLDHREKRELRELGWSLVGSEAERPTAIQLNDVLGVDEHVTLGERARESLLVELESVR
jgi:hypothetical protein